MSNFGEAMTVIARYLRVMSEATEVRLIVEGDSAVWRLRTTDGVPQPPAANDFSVLGFSDVRAFGRAFRRWTGQSPTEFRSVHRS